MSHSWSPVAEAAMIGIETTFERIRKTYYLGFVWLVIVSVFMVTLGVTLNMWGYPIANFYLAAGFLIAWAFLTFHPKVVLSVFGIGGLEGLPKGWSINQFLRGGTLPDLALSKVAKEGLEFGQKCLRWSAHLALFMTVVFVTLGALGKIEQGSLVVPAFVILAGLGFWASLFTKGSVWYKRVTLAILLVALVVVLYRAYVYTPPQNEVISAIDDTLLRHGDLVKKRRAEELQKRVHSGKELSKDELQELSALRSDDSAERAIKSVAEKLPISIPSGRPLQWEIYDHVECDVQWNDREAGPWCDAVDLPAGTYRFMAERTLWKQGDRGADEKIYHLNIPPEGLPLSSLPASTRSFIREFRQQAPRGGNERLGAIVGRIGAMEYYDPWREQSFTITKPKKVAVGVNIPPNPIYVQMNTGKIAVDIERLQ